MQSLLGGTSLSKMLGVFKGNLSFTTISFETFRMVNPHRARQLTGTQDAATENPQWLS